MVNSCEFILRRSFFSVIAFLFFSCSEDPVISSKTNQFEINLPRNFGESVPQPSDNIATENGVELGRKLFFDTKLSSNNKVSCATCHLPDLAFSDGVALSNKGVSGKLLLRNSPALFNLAWAKGFFADGGAKNLESQVFAPLQHPDELNHDINDLIKKLNSIKEYRSLSSKAFQSDTINSSIVAKSIAQFERTLISGNSKYDKWIRGEGEKLNSLELAGLQISSTLCFACHQNDFFTDFDYHNNGIDSLFTDNSHENLYKGRYRISGKTSDIGKYKTPTLRNLSFTAPYMHDGRFSNIDQVLDHYSNGIKSSNTLDAKLQKGGMKLSEEDKNAIKAFLKTLDDYDFIAKSILLESN